MKKMISYGRQCIEEDDIAAVIAALKSDYLTTGPKVAEFEQRFADYVGAKYAVACSNGTAALHLACLAADLGSGDEVITTPMTFAASANCVLYVGARPLFADIDEKTNNINPVKIREVLEVKKNVRAVIPVHYTGLPADMEEIGKIAQEHNLMVIEDACHALGSVYKGEKIGNCKYSDMAVFSFHPVKHITTGEGGMITTNSKKLYERLLAFRTHGIVREADKLTRYDGPWYHEMQYLGYNYRLTDFQCALGQSQLKKIERFVARRREIAGKYNKAFNETNGLITPFEPEGYFNAYHLYVLKLSDKSPVSRSELFNKLGELGISCQVHYIPVYFHPYYKELGYSRGIAPVAENHYQSIVSLPLFPAMTDAEVEYVIQAVWNITQVKRSKNNQ